MAEEKIDIGEHLRALHGTLRSLREELRLRFADLSDEVGALRASAASLDARLASIEAAQAAATKDVARLASVLDEESAGVLNRIRTDLETLHGEVVVMQARASDAELAMLDALARGTAGKGVARVG